MKITNRINALPVEEVLSFGEYNRKFVFKKFNFHGNINLSIGFLSSDITISNVQDGLTDEALREAIEKLYRTAMQDIAIAFYDFRRYNMGNEKFSFEN